MADKSASSQVGKVMVASGGVFLETAKGLTPLAPDSPIYRNSVIVTKAPGHVEVKFEDGTVLSQGANARMAVDNYVFDSQGSSPSSLLLNMGQGTFRVITGKIADQNPENFNVKTPLATIGIRGTDFSIETGPHGDLILVGKISPNHILLVEDHFGTVRFINYGGMTVVLDQKHGITQVREATPKEIERIQANTPITSYDYRHDAGPDGDGHGRENGHEGGGGSEGGGGREGGGEGDGHEGDGHGAQSPAADGSEFGAPNNPEPFGGNANLNLFGTEPLAPFGEYLAPEASGDLGGSPGIDRMNEPGLQASLPPELPPFITEPVIPLPEVVPPPPENLDIVGTSGADVLTGTSDANRIYGLAGDDLISGGAGNDTIYGMEDNDTIFGEEGDDNLLGGSGNDTVSGGVGSDTISGEEGSDTISGEAGNDLIFGGLGDDSLSGGGDNDKIYGEDGNDTLAGDGGNDEIFGGLGDDGVTGGDGDDNLDGMAGNDTLSGDAGLDNLYGGDGNDMVSGGIGSDNLFGGSGDDTLAGGADGDKIYGMGGNDNLAGGVGNDILFGGPGQDVFSFLEMGADNVDALMDFAKSGSLGGDYVELNSSVFAGLKYVADTVNPHLLNSVSLPISATLAGAPLQATVNYSQFVNGGNGQPSTLSVNQHYTLHTVLGAAAGTGSAHQAYLAYFSNSGRLYYDPDGGQLNPGGTVATLYTVNGAHPTGSSLNLNIIGSGGGLSVMV